jgi:hypothetical protein
MANTFKIKRRAGTPANPGAPAALAAGEIAVNFGGHLAGQTRPSLYVGDETGTVRVLLHQGDLASVSVTSKVIPGTGAGPNVDGNAQVAAPGWPWAVAAGEVPVVTHNGTAYMFTGGAGSYGTTAGGTALTAGMFTSLGAAPAVATAAQVRAGTINTAFLTPGNLANVLPIAVLTAGVSSAQVGHPTLPAAATGVAADANRIVVLGADGKIPASVIPVKDLVFQSADATLAAPAAPAHSNGLVVVNTGTGAAHAKWGITPAPTLSPGDYLMSDGVAWHFIPASTVGNQFLHLSGGPMTPGDTTKVTFAPTTVDGTVIVIDLGQGAIDNGWIDGGTF